MENGSSEDMLPLYYRLIGEESFIGPTAESEVLQFYRESQIPSGTLFRRGPNGPCKTLGELIRQNGSGCPFADFSDAGDRKDDSGRGSLRDENDNVKSSDSSRLTETILEAYQSINDRMVEIEQHYIKQQNRLAGAEEMMNRVRAMEMHLHQMHERLKQVEMNVSRLHDFIWFGKNSPMIAPLMRTLPAMSTVHDAEVGELRDETKRVHSNLERTQAFMNESMTVVSQLMMKEAELKKWIQMLDERHAQVLGILSSEEKAKKVNEVVKTLNESLEENLAKLPEITVTDLLASLCEETMVESATPRMMANPSSSSSSASPPRTISWRHSNPVMHEKMMGLLLGRERPKFAGDEIASESLVRQLSRAAASISGRFAQQITKDLGFPALTCPHCVAAITTGQSFLAHAVSKKHSNLCKLPLYKSDMQFFLDIVGRLS